MRLPPFAFWKSSGPPQVNPATLDARMYYDGATYNPATGLWAGTASAGDSGNVGRTATQAVALQRPTAGAPLNGLQTVHFDRAASQFLAVAPGFAPLFQYPIPSQQEALDWTCFALFNWDATGAPNNAIGTAYDNESIIGDFSDNRFNLPMRPTAAQILIYNGGGFSGKESPAPFTPGSWQLVTARGKSTSLDLRVNSSAFSSLAAEGRPFVTGTTLRIGCSTNPPGAFWLGDMALFLMVKGYLSNATCDGVKAWANARWGLAL